MLKKVMAMFASKYLAIKVRLRAMETRLMIQSLLLRDKKMVRHLFRHRKCFNLSNKVKDEDEDDDGQSENDPVATATLVNSSVATTPVSVIQAAEEAEDEDWQSESIDAFTYNSIATTPLINSSITSTPVSLAMEDEDTMETEDDDEYPDFEHSLVEDDQKENQSASVIEMVKNAKEGQGKKFILEDDIDQVAEEFIQRFHHQMRLQRSHL